MRSIPSIEQLRQREAMRPLEARYGRSALIEALRAEAAAVRARAAAGELTSDVVGAIEQGVPGRLARAAAPSLRAVINATGVIIHTNLGRAPLDSSAASRVAELAAGYTNLEYDLASGARGRRDVHAERLICQLTGAAAAVVVNNNAAATLVTLAALAAGREVVISRGELVEIGGGFRVPDVMAQSGAILREVGTTNRTRVADYAAAISENTALILRVHPSNFRIEGFVERPTAADLANLAKRFNIPLAEDLGSGYLEPVPGVAGLREEPLVSQSLTDGVDLVMFSGDKLLGGPQSGIVAGADGLVNAVKRHPLMRALRVDKMTYAALEATLEHYAAGRALSDVPVLRMMTLTAGEVGPRAERAAAALAKSGFGASVIDGESTIGGGSAPGASLPTRLIALTHSALTADDLATRLRALDPPIIARIDDGRVVLDLRTVLLQQDAALIAMVAGLAPL
ncbi:MAG: L-seryl-tRNA(Sec) selenium transferase [Acidobacteria bacterium]|nr:L-seryl-tRNA(Sec) selenium transferase [Acidobacteriota bacterium]MCA1648826.1 L-seryl-tRNA(Sec) selenium transferase [Acidobacteriota bacterium]